MRFPFCTLAALVVVAAAAAQAAPPPDASGWNMDMSVEFAAWRARPEAVDLARFKGDLPLGVRLDLKLRPNAELKFPVPPHREPKPDSFGGLPTFQVPKDGLYRVSAGASVWIDVVDGATAESVPSPQFGMKAGSDLRKCVLFPLKAGVRYILQISGSRGPSVSVLLTPDAR